MAARYYQKFSVTGSANSLVQDSDSLESLETEPKTLLGVLLYVTGQAGNTIEVWLDRERILEVLDYHVDTDESTGSTNTQKGREQVAFLELGHELPAGSSVKAGLRCGATAKNLHGAYVYEIR